MTLQASTDMERTTESSIASWWRSPWGPGPLIQVALPLMISSGLFSVTLFTDRTLLYWQAESSAAAAMGAGTLYWSLLCLPMGMLGYVSTFVSQYRGAGQPRQVGQVYQHGLMMAWLFVPVLLLGIWQAWSFFEWAGHSRELVQLESGYLRILLLGGIGVLFYSVQSGVLTGQGRTRTVLLMDGTASVVNLILDAVLIFGWGPIPACGIYGAAVATASSFWLKIPLAHWLISKDRSSAAIYGIGKRYPLRWSLLKRIAIYGAPAGLQQLAEAGCFSVIMLQVGRLGEIEMAATTLALGLNVLAFVPLMGLGVGVGVLVGQRLTEGRVDLARRSVSCAIVITVLYTSGFALLLGLFPDWMLGVYAIGTPPERFAEMRPILVPLLQIIALYCVLDGFQVVYVGAIKGAGDTWFVLIATILVAFSAIFAGIRCQAYFGPSLLLWWYVIAGWVATMGLVFAARYFSGSWESKRVIESTPPPDGMKE